MPSPGSQPGFTDRFSFPFLEPPHDLISFLHLDEAGALTAGRFPVASFDVIEDIKVEIMKVFSLAITTLLVATQGHAQARRAEGKNRLAILPNLTHYEVFMAPALLPAVLPFLNGESKAPIWTGQ